MASRWNIVCLGEMFEESRVFPVKNVVVKGKVSLQEYADYLSRASIGISLMISPHPSYPPLEMAEAGLTTITNCFGVKDLGCRFEGIVSLGYLDIDALASAIRSAIEMAEPVIGNIARRRVMNIQPLRNGRMFDAFHVASLLRQATSRGQTWPLQRASRLPAWLLAFRKLGVIAGLQASAPEGPPTVRFRR
jgi:hypothetical protein